MLCSILSLAVQPIFSMSSYCLSRLFFSLQMRNENGLKGFSDVFQDFLLHDLSRDRGYWLVAPLGFPRGVALAIFQAASALPYHSDQDHG